jgi:hypothetical protein
MNKPNRKPNTTCDVCDKPIYRKPNALQKNKNKFCSHSCQLNMVHSDKELQKHYMRNSKLPVMYGKDNPAWKGGITMFKKKGNYKNVKYVRCPQEFLPMSRKDGYIMEHRLVMAKWVGRCLDRKEVVHHIDHDPSNNNKQNLLLFPCNSSHKKYEGIENGKSKNNLQGIRNRIR